MTSKSASPAEVPQRLVSLSGWLLGKSANMAAKIVNEHLDEPSQRGDFAILSTLHEGQRSQAELGRIVGYDRSDVAAIVDDMESRGFLTRERDDNDRRRNIVRITKLGKTHLQRLEGLFEKAEEEILEQLSPQERRDLKRLLQRLLAI